MELSPPFSHGSQATACQLAKNKLRVLRLTRVEANVDSKTTKGQRILEGLLQGTRVLGVSTATLSNDRLR